MNAQEWDKLRQNWTDLLKVRANTLSAHLYEKGTLNSNEKETIENLRTNSEQMDKLLNILKAKQLNLCVFKALLNALEMDYKWLADKITESVSKADASIFSQEDPHLIDEVVRCVLHQHYTNKPGTVSLLELRETLRSKGVFTGKNEWSNEILINFVKSEFLGVEVLKQKKPNLKHKKPTILLKNIDKIDPSDEILASQSVKGDKIAEKELKDMKPSELKQFLGPQFEMEGYDKKILEDMERQGISGKVLMTMKEDDFKETIPNANFGVRRCLKMVIEKHTKTAESKPMPQHLCKFDSIVQPTDKYVKGHCADVNSYFRGKTTTAVRNFHLVKDENKEAELDYISVEVVTFASACLNNRRNGTIYFGISPSARDGFKTGEIVGVNHPTEVVQDKINAYLTSAFSSIQKNIISGTIRSARFVPVISDDLSEADLFVVEVDVIPNSSIMADETIRTKLEYLPQYNKKDKSKLAVFRFSDEGYPAVVSPDEMTNYERDKSRIIQQRKDDENISIVESTPDLRVRLRNLLTGGAEKFEDTSYIFMMTSPIDAHMDQAYLLKNTTFIKNLRPEVVFDFDPKGSTDGIYNNLDSQQEEKMRVLIIPNNFDKEGKKQEEYTNFLDGLANESKISWIFCNGYIEMSIDPMTPTEWNRNRRSAFQDGLKFYIENFNKDRIIFMICLFSINYSAMIEACDEVVTKLPENWLLIAETEQVAKLWQDQILARNRVEKRDLLDRSVIGMPWEQINTTINQTLREPESHECFLPCSTGAQIEVREKKLKDWCDIDILSAGEFKIPGGGKEKCKKEVEEKFYKGEQVDWLNFSFHDQVLKRDIHEDFKKLVKEALQGRNKDEEDKVTTVAILHQPGAGGTTSSKQVLWDLRKEYRCCVVNNITDQTADQLDEIRCFGDISPKPLLILIDDEEEEKYTQLGGKLEEKGRRRWRDQQESFNVYCTIILCIRRASLPKLLKSRQISLRQELNINELDWFKRKSETLTSRFERNKENNVNPKFLISFNILKENFNTDYVSKVVKEFSDDVKNPQEVKILKVVSLLNSFDPDFKPIRVACLDKILENQQDHRVRQHPGNLKRNVGWEANLSQGVKVLLNLSSNSKQPGKARKCLRVFNKVIAQEIFKKMKERTGQKASEIMLELIETSLYEQPTYDAKDFQGIINSVMKKREYNSDGRRHKFSQFVLYVQQNEGAEVALRLLENLFEMTKDPFTAQQISRFYIELKNWSQAEFYAKSATNLLPGNSFLWDTHGQVFKNQLYDKLASQKTLDRAEGFNSNEIHKLIQLTESCINCFRRAQKLSEDEFTTGGENNFAGYFGELRAIVILLSALKLCPAFHKDEMLHRFLVDQHYKLSYFDEHDSDYLKKLEKFATEAMRRLDEEYLQMKGNINLDIVAPKFDFDRKSLLDLKVNLDDYFGEPTDAAPRNLCESDACEYRLRRARKLGATSLNLLLRMRQDGQLSSLVQIYNLLIENVNSRNNFDDLRSILDTLTVYLLDGSSLPGLGYEQILKWCKQLYSLNSTNISTRSYLEIYLYYVLYNFPTDQRQNYELCMPMDLVSAINNWHLAFTKNYPKCTREEIHLKRRETTLFFLGNGKPLRDIVHQDSLEVMSDFSLQEKWQLPEVRARLRLQQGILGHGGEKINLSIITKDGNTFELKIPTSHRVTKRDMWQKRVFFYIGFSFSGPRAFGMTSDESVQAVPHPLRVKPTVYMQNKKQSPTLIQLFKDLKSTEAEIEKNKDWIIKAQLLRKYKEISDAIKNLVGE